jgi:hypothetical protein
VVGLLRGEGGDQARVEAAREVGAHRDVGAQAQADAVAKQRLEVFALGAGGAELRLPPAPLLDNPPALPDQHAPGLELADAAKRRPRRARPPEREDVVDPLRVRLGGHLPGREQRLRLRAEDEGPVVEGRVVQGPDPKAIANQGQTPRIAVPERERELPVETLQGAEAVALDQPQYDLGVRGGREALARGLELGAQLDVVVDLAVVDDRAPAGGDLDRLPAAGDVEDRQPRGREPRPGVQEQAVAVGPAVADRRHHAQNRLLIDVISFRRTDDPR